MNGMFHYFNLTSETQIMMATPFDVFLINLMLNLDCHMCELYQMHSILRRVLLIIEKPQFPQSICVFKLSRQSEDDLEE